MFLCWRGGFPVLGHLLFLCPFLDCLGLVVLAKIGLVFLFLLLVELWLLMRGKGDIFFQSLSGS